jgi:hypothetical protein
VERLKKSSLPNAGKAVKAKPGTCRATNSG